MHGIRNVLATYKQYFSDPTGLGVFVDNHDVTRFLHDQRDWKQLQNALTYTVFAEGISIIYYGTEQAYSGGTDPNNREPLWASGYNTDAHFYKFIQTLLKFKNSLISEITINPQEERFVSDQFYVRDPMCSMLVLFYTDSGIHKREGICRYNQCWWQL